MLNILATSGRADTVFNFSDNPLPEECHHNPNRDFFKNPRSDFIVYLFKFLKGIEGSYEEALEIFK